MEVIDFQITFTITDEHPNFTWLQGVRLFYPDDLVIMVNWFHAVPIYSDTKIGAIRNCTFRELDHFKTIFVQKLSRTSRYRKCADRHINGPLPIFCRHWFIPARCDQVIFIIIQFSESFTVQLQNCRIGSEPIIFDIEGLTDCNKLICIWNGDAFFPFIQAGYLNLYAVITQ